MGLRRWARGYKANVAQGRFVPNDAIFAFHVRRYISGKEQQECGRKGGNLCGQPFIGLGLTELGPDRCDRICIRQVMASQRSPTEREIKLNRAGFQQRPEADAKPSDLVSALRTAAGVQRTMDAPLARAFFQDGIRCSLDKPQKLSMGVTTRYSVIFSFKMRANIAPLGGMAFRRARHSLWTTSARRWTFVQTSMGSKNCMAHGRALLWSFRFAKSSPRTLAH
jgi:hypothetical protein